MSCCRPKKDPNEALNAPVEENHPLLENERAQRRWDIRHFVGEDGKDEEKVCQTLDLCCNICMLFCLAASVLALVLMHPKHQLKWAIVICSIVAAYILGCICDRYAAKWIGGSIIDAVESLDRDYIGADVHIEHCEVYLSLGRVVIGGVTVDNPSADYESEYLIKCDLMVLDINMSKLLLSLGRNIIIQRFILQGIDVIVEFQGYKCWGETPSNVKDVLNFMKAKKAEEAPAEEAPAEEAAPDVEKQVSSCDKCRKQLTKGGTMKGIPIIELDLLDIRANLKSKLGNLRLDVPDVRHDNFTEHHAREGDLTMQDLVLYLCQIILSGSLYVADTEIKDKRANIQPGMVIAGVDG